MAGEAAAQERACLTHAVSHAVAATHAVASGSAPSPSSPSSSLPPLQPYSDGLLVQLCVSPKAAKRLRGSPLLAALLPQARWVDAEA